MPALESATIQCPYCWETQELSVDPSAEDQEYVEDCQVCCQPMLVHVVFDDDRNLTVTAVAENG
ncbi:CPXCG motif-containing cysteine-rich protein [Marinobacter sp.]|uniref:CPXCG motif-containing cysteine-rich protein n=1 Tax=Marinobacter sp. TaxID=50741 RepID=UPI0019894A5B|nr:CPXCG motif-containing cysteine-rich protein [Marinobacter sp.]MBD3657355.1 CPXCG motif-containing cysteine-rich protein [Marinobacter sp.]